MEKYEVDPDETQDYSCPTLHVAQWSRKCLSDGDVHEVILIHEDTKTPTRILLSGRVAADFRDCIRMTEGADAVTEIMVRPIPVDCDYNTGN